MTGPVAGPWHAWSLSHTHSYAGWVNKQAPRLPLASSPSLSSVLLRHRSILCVTPRTRDYPRPGSLHLACSIPGCIPLSPRLLCAHSGKDSLHSRCCSHTRQRIGSKGQCISGLHHGILLPGAGPPLLSRFRPAGQSENIRWLLARPLPEHMSVGQAWLALLAAAHAAV